MQSGEELDWFRLTPLGMDTEEEAAVTQVIFRFIYHSNPAAGITESRACAAAMHFMLWSTPLLSSNEKALICRKPGCVPQQWAGDLASLPGIQISRQASLCVQGLAGKGL